MQIIAQENNPTSFYRIIAPIILAVFAVYLTIGITLGVLPAFLQTQLHLGNAAIGIVIGLQSLATLLTRAYAGKLTDAKGAKTSSYAGVILAVTTGIIYVSAALLHYNTWLAALLIILSRVVHGISESMLVTGALTWGIGLTGAGRSGKVMTWNGIAMYAGIAAGAPLGIWLQYTSGIQIAFALIILLSLSAWLVTLRLPPPEINPERVRTPFYKIIGKIANQGLGLAFASIGFACISSFVALFFAGRHWGDASMAFLCFGACYVLTRICCASFTDRFGGYSIALISLAVELGGQLLVAYAPDKSLAIAGCGLTGIGFSLIFPALGVLAIKKVTPQMRGTALGAYTAFFDLSLGLAGPLAGLIAGAFGYAAVYLFGAASSLAAILILFTNRKNNDGIPAN